MKNITSEYKEVFEWLKNMDSYQRSQIENANIAYVACTFSKSLYYIKSLVQRVDYDKLTAGEYQIILFFYYLCKRQMLFD
jgi:hypothetical protein